MLTKKKYFLYFAIILIILISVFLSSCTGSSGNKKVNRNIFTGKEGLNFELTNSVPDEVYEETSFFFGVKINNLGTYTITEDNPAILSVTTGDVYLKFDDAYLEQNNKIFLEGSSEFYPEGETAILELPEVYVNPISGALQNPKTELYISLCYPYSTSFSENFCMDFDVYNQDEREKVCIASEKTFSRGQGAPIAVTKVTPLMNSVSDGLNPTYLIEVENLNQGLPWYEEQKKCLDKNYAFDTWNKIKISGKLSTFNLICKPEIIKLVDNKGTTVCTTDGKFAKGTNFETVLNLKLDYNYIDSISKEINILRMPTGMDYDVIRGAESCEKKNEGDSCYTDSKMVCNENKKCEDKCSYCARIEDNAKTDCGNIKTGFSCLCTASDIRESELTPSQYENNACRLGVCCNLQQT